MEEMIKYLNDLFGITSDTSAPILITLFVLVFSQLLFWIVSIFNKIGQRRQTRKIFETIISSAIITTRKQERIFNETYEFWSFDNISNLMIKKLEFFHLTHLEEIGFNATHNSFFSGVENWVYLRKRKIRNKAFIKCWGTMKSIDFWVRQSYESIDQFSVKFNSLNDKRNDTLNEIGEKVDNLLFSHRGTNVDPKTRIGSYLFKLIEINKSHRKKNDLRPHRIHRNWVVPLRILNRKYPELIELSEINSLLIKASMSYEGMFLLLKAQRQQYFIYANNFRYNYRVFSKALSLLKSIC